MNNLCKEIINYVWFLMNSFIFLWMFNAFLKILSCPNQALMNDLVSNLRGNSLNSSVQLSDNRSWTSRQTNSFISPTTQRTQRLECKVYAT